MKDTDLRGLILKKYYEKRREGFFQWTSEDFTDVPETVDFDAVDLFRICDQLAEHGLIDWKPLRGGQGQTIGGAGKITAFGVDVIEGDAKPPISITIDKRNIAITNSSNVQIGNANVQKLSIEEIIEAINKSKDTESHKSEAKSRLQEFLKHPLVTSIVQGLTSHAKV